MVHLDRPELRQAAAVAHAGRLLLSHPQHSHTSISRNVVSVFTTRGLYTCLQDDTDFFLLQLQSTASCGARYGCARSRSLSLLILTNTATALSSADPPDAGVLEPEALEGSAPPRASCSSAFQRS